MNVGELNNLITIQKMVKTQDEAGGRVEDWVDFVQAWAEIRPTTGGEKFFSHERYASVSHQIIIRWVEGIEPKMRILYGSRVFEIEAALDTKERKRMIRILAREELNHG